VFDDMQPCGAVSERAACASVGLQGMAAPGNMRLVSCCESEILYGLLANSSIYSGNS
jgi:hypothetical protein